VDIVVLSDIKELWGEDLGGYALGAVLDTGLDDTSVSKGKLGMAPTSLYFNAGVELIDCKQWREQNIIKQLFELEPKIRNNLSCCDQCLLNKYFEGNYKLLSLRYNAAFIDSDEHKVSNLLQEIASIYGTNETSLSQQHQKPLLRHFYRGKPWHSRNGNPNFSDFWFFVSMTPFYDGLRLKFDDREKDLQEAVQKKHEKEKLLQEIEEKWLRDGKRRVRTFSLFGFLPILKLKTIGNTKTEFYLLGLRVWSVRG
jgi:lipopolysaccharide biosynthesis glycosyltransferase